MKRIFYILFSILDFILFPLTLVASSWFRLIKYVGVGKMPISRSIFFKIGVFPIVDHYYEPLFNYNKLRLNNKKYTTCFAFRFDRQLELLKLLAFYKAELESIPTEATGTDSFYLRNGSFVGFDAYFLYAFLRHIKPKRIIEVGSGFSTKLILNALSKNDNKTSIICIEPYEEPGLENIPVQVIRKCVENIEPDYFRALSENDILFIDSSHVIRPQGDVLHEILEILPALKKGVYIHFHDIFIPSDYPVRWIKNEFRLWNEQYLLNAFLAFNDTFEIVFTTHVTCFELGEEIKSIFPFMGVSEIGGCSFWIRKVK